MKKKCLHVVTDENGTKKVCGFEYESGDAYCSDCGTPLKTNTKPRIESGMKKKKKKCTNIVIDEKDGTKKVCGFEYEIGDAYCSECGATLKTNNKPRIWIVLLITTLFLGGTTYFGIRATIDSKKVEIVAESSDDTMGTVLGGGIYVKDTIVMLVAQSKDGFAFDMWDDGKKDTARWIKTVENHKYVAIFKQVEPTNPTDTMKNGKDVHVPLSSIQQEFDDLCIEFDRRMRDSMSFGNAYQLITGDYELLLEILRMLDENPWLHAEPSSHYIERFKKRAGEAMERINYAIFPLDLPHDDSIKYTLQKNEIEKMMNGL